MWRTKKVLIKALAACLLDSIWDSKSAYIVASVCTLVEVGTAHLLACVILSGLRKSLNEVQLGQMAT